MVAGGSLGTGRILARQAGCAGYEVRLVDEPERAALSAAALLAAAAVVIVPARAAPSPAAQVRAVLTATLRGTGAAAGATAGPRVILVSGFSVGHGTAHALNTPARLSDRLQAEDLVRRSRLPYTIVRPTWLTSDPPGGYAVTLTQDPYADGMIARADLAGVCLAAIAEPAAQGKTFAVFAQPSRATLPWSHRFAALEPDAVS